MEQIEWHSTNALNVPVSLLWMLAGADVTGSCWRPQIANSIFQFIEETKPWFLHDPNAEAPSLVMSCACVLFGLKLVVCSTVLQVYTYQVYWSWILFAGQLTEIFCCERCQQVPRSVSQAKSIHPDVSTRSFGRPYSNLANHSRRWKLFCIQTHTPLDFCLLIIPMNSNSRSADKQIGRNLCVQVFACLDVGASTKFVRLLPQIC